MQLAHCARVMAHGSEPHKQIHAIENLLLQLPQIVVLSGISGTLRLSLGDT